MPAWFQGLFGLAALVVVGLQLFHRYAAVTEDDRHRISEHYEKRGEEIISIVRAGLEQRWGGYIRRFRVEVASRDGARSIRTIGLSTWGSTGAKFWRYDADGRGHPMF